MTALVRELVREALGVLGVERFVCAIHDRSLPSTTAEDLGCGSVASSGAHGFFAFLSELGFDGVQLGPPGIIAPENLSPYDGTVFSRSTLGLSVAPLSEGIWGPTLGAVAKGDLGDGAPENTALEPSLLGHRSNYSRAFALNRTLLARIHRQFSLVSGAERQSLDRDVARFRGDNEAWLSSDAVHAALTRRFASPDSRVWPEPERLAPSLHPPGELASRLAVSQAEVDRYAFEQWLLAEQHALGRARAQKLGLSFYGDLQAGMSHADRWAARDLLLADYAMGAPPSRTNPAGQPWGYPVLDPRKLATEGPGLGFFRRRIHKLFSEYDALRIDHPHALVCPWVYREGQPDPYEAVRAGTRLFATPAGVPLARQHAALTELAIARNSQLDVFGSQPHDDGWVRELSGPEVDRYAHLVDEVVAIASQAGRGRFDVVCEVLSTMPFPLAKVLERHALGRFRVTQKARPDDPTDVYLPKNARAADWIMVGTHDTPPLWAVVRRWESEGKLSERIRWLAQALGTEAERESLRSFLGSRVEHVVLAETALLFASEAKHVMMFVSDLMGETADYNVPGTVDPANWTLRVPPDFRAVHRRRVLRGEAFDVFAALALALHARGAAPEIVNKLVELASCPLPKFLDSRGRA